MDLRPQKMSRPICSRAASGIKSLSYLSAMQRTMSLEISRRTDYGNCGLTGLHPACGDGSRYTSYGSGSETQPVSPVCWRAEPVSFWVCLSELFCVCLSYVEPCACDAVRGVWYGVLGRNPRVQTLCKIVFFCQVFFFSAHGPS